MEKEIEIDGEYSVIKISNATKKFGRRLLREVIFKILFEADIRNEGINSIYEDYLKREDFTIKNKEDLEFLKKYIEGISSNILEIKDAIRKNMENWTLERIGISERSLLILSVYEILKEDIPDEIVVNEVVELAKEYCDTKAFEFINGVLANVIRAN